MLRSCMLHKPDTKRKTLQDFIMESQKSTCCTGIDRERLNYASIEDTSPDDQGEKEKVLTLMVVGMDCQLVPQELNERLKASA